MEVCPHPEKENGFCLHCFSEVRSYNIHNREKTRSSTLKPDLAKFKGKFNEELLDRAEQIYQDSNIPTYRTTKRNSVILLCLFEANLQLKLGLTANDIAKTMGLKSSDVPSILALKTKLALHNRSVNNIHISTPIEFLKQYLIKIGITDPTEQSDIEVLSIQTLDDIPDLKKFPPQIVAVALIYNYFSCKHGTISLDSLVDRLGVNATQLFNIVNTYLQNDC